MFFRGWFRKNLPIGGACIEERGDWQWRKMALGLVGWNGAGDGIGRCCFKCGANKTTHPFTEVGKDAQWVDTVHSNLQILNANLLAGNYVSKLWSIPGFRHVYMMIDLMHTGCLGICQYLLGNVLWELFLEFGGIASDPISAKNVTSQLWCMIRMGSRHMGLKNPPVHYLTMNMFRAPGCKPKLKTNAAETRHMLKAMFWVLENLVNKDTPHAKLRFDCLRNLHLFYLETENWVDGESEARARVYGRNHIVAYAELGKEFLALGTWQRYGWIQWRFYPKHHLFLHLVGEQLVEGNPRLSWAYGDERFIGAAVELAETSHPNALHRSIVERQRL